jgi:hypothetical protein
MGRAEELFQRIKDGGVAEIQRMIAEQVTEELFLDYKQAATKGSFSKLDLSDRKNLAKAISGFGNSDGGIIVWGVDCRSSLTGDIPSDAPVDNPVALKSLLDGAVGGVTLPGHGGVENEALQLPNGKGYVVTHVPPGLNVPYRTILGEKEEYYIRAGSNFLPTPHAVLAGLFGRAPHSILEINVRYAGFKRLQNQLRAQVRLPVALRNNGRGLARGVFLCLDSEAPKGVNLQRNIDHNRWQDWTSRTARGERYSAVATPNFPAIPPGSQNDVLDLVLEMPVQVSSDVIITITCGAENGPGSSYSATLTKDALSLVAEIATHSYPNEPERLEGKKKAKELIEACLRPRGHVTNGT